jgi:putative cell wall-binding protein
LVVLKLYTAAVMALIGAVAISGVGASAAYAGPDGSDVPPELTAPAPEPIDVQPPVIPDGDRDAKLGEGWSTSTDVVTTAVGDALAFNIYVASAAEGYSWHRVASLNVEGVETDRWIGNTCLSEDHSKVAVVYAPRAITNDEQMFQRGAFGAVVNLADGSVTDLGLGFSIAYFNPGCGVGNTAAFSAFSDLGETRAHLVDMAAPNLDSVIEVPVQLSSLTPTAGGLVAAANGAVVGVADDGALTTLATAQGVPYDLATAGDALAFVDNDGTTASVRTAAVDGSAPASEALASGSIVDLGISASAGGAYITGPPAALSAELPEGLHQVDAEVGSTISSNGEVAVMSAAPLDPLASGQALDPTRPDAPISIEAKSLTTGEPLGFVVDPGGSPTEITESDSLDPSADAATYGSEYAGGQVQLASDTQSNARAALLAGSSSNPVETERSCAVARNDPGSQAMQPKPRQVEWAVDEGVDGNMPITRTAGYLNISTANYKPQDLFPLPALVGGGTIPPQIMLGVIAQESNLSQAARYAVPGVTGNPLIGNFYGLANRDVDTQWAVDFPNADCGYGVAQVTDGMRLAGQESEGQVPAMSTLKQRAVALDYAANVAAGIQILAQKWNQTRSAGLTVNDGNPAYIENWFFAVWAYNTGFYAQGAAGEPWGVGWQNNPVNPEYPANRHPFLDGHPEDGAAPQNWPYPEKVLGFAAHSYTLPEDATHYVAAFNPAWWNDETYRSTVKPPRTLFCKAINNCDPTKSVEPTAPGLENDPAGPCLHKNSAGQYDLKCWYNGNATWKTDCAGECGHWDYRFDPGVYLPQEDAQSFPPNCSKAATEPNNPFSRGLPPGTVYVIDDVPNGTPEYRSSCTRQTTRGSFALNFGAAPQNGTFPSKIDFHQLGAGFNGHFYLAHTRNLSTVNDRLKVTGTWTLDGTLNQWARVMVHMPDHGAWTQQAQYTVNLGNGTSKTRSLLQRTGANSWVPLGVFQFAGTPSVSLSNITHDGDGYDDVAWDAIAIQPLSAKPIDFVVAMGDSYSSGEGASENHGESYYQESDQYGINELSGNAPYYNSLNDNDDLKWNRDRNACHRSTESWTRKASLPSSPSATIGQRADALNSSIDFQFLACSGAETENVLPYFTAPSLATAPVNAWGQTGRYGKYREDSQLDRGFLDENTTLVTLTIGGNDARFETVLNACIPQILCSSSQPTGDTQLLPAEETNLINTKVKTSVKTALGEIAARAPNAKILIQGYPKLFEMGSSCVLVLDNQREWLNDMSDLLNQKIEEAANEVDANLGSGRIVYADPHDFFQGRTLCSGIGSAINGLNFDETGGDGGSKYIHIPLLGPDGQITIPSQQSVHPNKVGTSLYAQSMMSALDSSRVTFTRVFGADRFSGSVAISNAAFPDSSVGAPVVWVASGETFPDALSAGPAAAKQGGPLLLTATGSLPSTVASEIQRLHPQKVVIAGGPNSVSETVKAQIQALVPNTVRLSGADRFEASRNIAAYAFGTSVNKAYVATGNDFPDAISGGAAGAALKYPILLVNGQATTADAATKAALQALHVSGISVVGGTNSVTSGIATALGTVATTTRISGADRYEVSRNANGTIYSAPSRVFIATGANFPDALPGAALAARQNGPLFLVPGTCIPSATWNRINALGAKKIVIIGGPASVSDDVSAPTIC